MNRFLLSTILLISGVVLHMDQLKAGDFDLSAYNQFLEQHEDISTQELLDLYPAGKFKATAPFDFQSARYAQDIERLFDLTRDEINLAETNGFMVTERYNTINFRNMLAQIFHKDMPLYISSDMILDAFHQSYLDILIYLEREIFVDELDQYLTKTHAELAEMAIQYTGNELLMRSLQDADMHITMARQLLHRGQSPAPQPIFDENLEQLETLLLKIEKEEPGSADLYTDDCSRGIDFSQFRVRGHYANPRHWLQEYFQAVMWLGRVGLITKHSEASPGCAPEYIDEDEIRGCITAAALTFAGKQSGGDQHLEVMETAIQAFIGRQDNVNFEEMLSALNTLGFNSLGDIADRQAGAALRDHLRDNASAQKIVSRIMSAGVGPGPTDPPNEFLVFGQRFIIDSYITMNVTFDRIVYKRSKVKRWLPSSQDILFSLGNDASAQLLLKELDSYNYADNLASLRYLLGTFGDEFWQSSTYNAWLNGIKQLNPPAKEVRDELPRFMQTAAWWQKTMTTQLASWAQLRHDNILYAKPSYGLFVCEFPDAYVEPMPDFYASIAEGCSNIADRFANISGIDDRARERLQEFYTTFGEHCLTLEQIAIKELEGEALTTAESEFLQKTLTQEHTPNCAVNTETIKYDGWYMDLYYNAIEEMTSTVVEPDHLVVDIHTDTQNDQVFHAGTGPVNLAMILVEDCDGQATAYVGPVLSYYEEVTLNYDRLTDERWRAKFEEGEIPSRPAYTKRYLADLGGNKQINDAPSLFLEEEATTSITEKTGAVQSQVAPNPFNNETTISFNVPHSLGLELGSVQIFDLRGQLCAELFNGVIPMGTSSLRWDGRDGSGNQMPAGTYVYRITIGEHVESGNISLVR